MPEEMAARYARYSTAELFELARGGESKLRPEAWQSLKNELQKRGLELTPEDEALASGRPGDSVTTHSELQRSEPVSDSPPDDGIGGWLVVFVAFIALNVALRTYQSLAAFNSQFVIAVFYGLHAVILATGIVLVYQRDPLAPRFWRDVLLLTAALNVFLAAVHSMDWSQALLSAGVLIAWAAYWTKSRRVRATFGLSASTTSPDQELEASPAQTASDAAPVPSIEELNAELDDARRQGNYAVLFLVSGLALSIGTWASSGGRRYYIAWAAILFGLIGAARSNARRKRAKTLLENAAPISQIGE